MYVKVIYVVDLSYITLNSRQDRGLKFAPIAIELKNEIQD